jgi:HEPN domain-containing protein
MPNDEVKQNPWLSHASSDIKAAEALISNAEFTAKVVFFCQQAVEKYLKAVLFELKIPIQKTHDLLKLYDKVKEFKDWKIDETKLDNLCDLYIESRYPVDIVLLKGEILPSVEDAQTYLEFAKSVASLVDDSV